MHLFRARKHDFRRRHRPRSQRFALRAPEQLEARDLMAAQPFGAMADDTGEFMLGDVHVTVVLMESSTQTGPTNNNSETWTAASIASVKQKITEGMQWWEDTLAARTTKHELDFQLDFTHANAPVSTNYEPITRPSTDFQFWIYDFLNLVGFNNRGNFHNDIRAFNDAQRVANDADWAFTIFVVNDEKDPDHQFAPGGFSRAFAFAGGELLVSPASRPASTFAHETGHQFWGLDEYRPDGDSDRTRGYYNTQNLNSWDNPATGFVQQPSIMSNGSILDTAYANHTSAPSTLEMIGWKDSDGDGVFDVLDVPLTLSGSGAYDATAAEYRFQGTSSVQTLPNKNTSGLKNDITTNEVSRAEYRLNGGSWVTAATYGTPQAALDLRIPVTSTSAILEIRTIDGVTGITSPIFQTIVNRPAGVLMPGINGVIWNDADEDGNVDATERGLAGVTVQLVDNSGQPVQLQRAIEPDSHASGTRLNTVSPHATISAFGTGVTNDMVAAFAATGGSTGANVFASFSTQCGGHCIDWTPETRQMRIDFTSPTSTVSLDASGSSVAGYARLEIYNSNNELLGRYTTEQLSSGESETMTMSRPTSDIAYAIAKGHVNSAVRFDNLTFGPQTTAVSDQNGAYAIPYLPAGNYLVKTVLTPHQTATSPHAGVQPVNLAEGEFQGEVDFGIVVQNSPWQNPNNRFDINGDGAVAPLDALAVINSLNRDGTRVLDESDTTPPYLDVNGDFQLAPLDALQVINELNRKAGGEGEAGSGTSFVASSVSYGVAEAELGFSDADGATDASLAWRAHGELLHDFAFSSEGSNQATRALLAASDPSDSAARDRFFAKAAQKVTSSHDDRTEKGPSGAEHDDADLESILDTIAADICADDSFPLG